MRKSWQRFLKREGGKGKSMAQLSAQYRREQSGKKKGTKKKAHYPCKDKSGRCHSSRGTYAKCRKRPQKC